MKRLLLALSCLALVIVASGCSSAGDVSESGAMDKQKQMQDATDASLKKDAGSAKTDRE